MTFGAGSSSWPSARSYSEYRQDYHQRGRTAVVRTASRTSGFSWSSSASPAWPAQGPLLGPAERGRADLLVQPTRSREPSASRGVWTSLFIHRRRPRRLMSLSRSNRNSRNTRSRCSRTWPTCLGEIRRPRMVLTASCRLDELLPIRGNLGGDSVLAGWLFSKVVGGDGATGGRGFEFTGSGRLDHCVVGSFGLCSGSAGCGISSSGKDRTWAVSLRQRRLRTA